VATLVAVGQVVDGRIRGVLLIGTELESVHGLLPPARSVPDAGRTRKPSKCLPAARKGAILSACGRNGAAG
jgi:hypothetical protein